MDDPGPAAADPFDLDRFVTVQETAATYAAAIRELRAGHKTSHWMWFIFPQVAGLGRSARSRKYSISGLPEAMAYLAHPLLGPRLRECCGILNSTPSRTAEQIFGSIDCQKLQSSMTLFHQAAPNETLFAAVLEQYFDSAQDQATIRLL